MFYFFLRSSCSLLIVLHLPPPIAKGRTNVELREKFILPEGTHQVMASFRYRGRRSRPSSRAASPNRSNSSHSCTAHPNPPQTSTPKVSVDCLLRRPMSFSICLLFPSQPSTSSQERVLFCYLCHCCSCWLLFFFMPFISLCFGPFFCVPMSPMLSLISPSLCVMICHCSSQTQHITRNYDKPWLTNSKPSTPLKSSDSFESQGSSSEV